MTRVIYYLAANPAVGAYESRFLRLYSLAVHLAFTKGGGAALALNRRHVTGAFSPEDSIMVQGLRLLFT